MKYFDKLKEKIKNSFLIFRITLVIYAISFLFLFLMLLILYFQLKNGTLATTTIFIPVSFILAYGCFFCTLLFYNKYRKNLKKE